MRISKTCRLSWSFHESLFLVGKGVGLVLEDVAQSSPFVIMGVAVTQELPMQMLTSACLALARHPLSCSLPTLLSPLPLCSHTLSCHPFHTPS